MVFDYDGKSHSFDRSQDIAPEVGEVLICNIEGHKLRLRVAEVIRPGADGGTVPIVVRCVVLP